jgi:hypothetical protein
MINMKYLERSIREMCQIREESRGCLLAIKHVWINLS